MAEIKSFEELKCWKSARGLVLLIYTVTETGPISRDFALKDQLRRAALSVMNNIAEGFARESNKEFVRFLDISHASCIEVKSMTYVLEDLKRLPPETITVIFAKLDETKGLTRGLMKYLRTRLSSTHFKH